MLVAERLAALLVAYKECVKSGNTEWSQNHKQKIKEIFNKYLPLGSGFDNGTHLDWEESGWKKLVFTCDYHHMNDVGMYSGWSSSVITATPYFGGFDVEVETDYDGVDEDVYTDDHDDYVAEQYQWALSLTCDI